MMPARLTSSLLVRKGHANPSGLDAPSGGLGQPRPAADTLARPAATCAPMVEILVPGRGARPAPGGSGRPNPADQVRLTVRIDRTLHTRLRVLAARQRRTNRDIVEGALEAYLNVFAASCACVRDTKAKT
jgi:hypothetical protein